MIRLAGLMLLMMIGMEAGPQLKEAFSRGGVAHAADIPMHEVQIDADEVYRGELLLIDNAHPVHEAGTRKDIVNLYIHQELVNGYGLRDTTISLSKLVTERWQAMVRAAKTDGVRHFVVNSGYRNEAEQRQLYESKGPDDALPPGFSEHNLGLSMDIGSAKAEMSRAPEGSWLSKNAWKYGFILRYPKDKTAVTGIQFEPWHFRYVGLPHSVIMHENDWTLEEYLDELKRAKSMAAHVEGTTYRISYYPVSAPQADIDVPVEGTYTVSGDNKGGIIVTVRMYG